MRQAVHLAVDVDMILEAAYFGEAERATGLIPRGFTGYRETMPYAPRDVAAARALLDEAGLGDGFRANVAVMNVSDALAMAQVLQTNLADIGIDLEILSYEAGTFWTLGLESEGDDWKDLQMVIQRWGNGPDQSFTTRWYTCSQVGEWNWERWCNEEYSELDQIAAREIDENKRGEIYTRMADLLDASAAYVPLTYGMRALLHRDWFMPGATPDGNRFLFKKFRLV